MILDSISLYQKEQFADRPNLKNNNVEMIYNPQTEYKKDVTYEVRVISDFKTMEKPFEKFYLDEIHGETKGRITKLKPGQKVKFVNIKLTQLTNLKSMSLVCFV